MNEGGTFPTHECFITGPSTCERRACPQLAFVITTFATVWSWPSSTGKGGDRNVAPLHIDTDIGSRVPPGGDHGGSICRRNGPFRATANRNGVLCALATAMGLGQERLAVARVLSEQ